MTTTDPRPASLRGTHLTATIGIFSLAFMFAFETIAVLTVMPVVAADLDGLSWFGVAFAAPMATGIVALTVSGWWCDRSGPGVPMLTGVALFVTGLVVAGLAGSMSVFLVGRAVQGLGSGLAGVALYVVIGQAFPESIRAGAMAVLTSAWTLPAVVGPPLAGLIARAVGWRWVFLAVPLLAVATVTLLIPALRQSGRGGASTARPNITAAVVVAAAVLGLAVAGQRNVPGWALWAIAALAVVLVAGPRLLPTGTWRGAPGLPSAIATRGLLSAGYFGAEAYFPLSLVAHRGLGTAASGFVLTGAAFAWFAGAWCTAHLPAFADRRRRLLVGSTSVLVATMAVLGSLVTWVPISALVAGWAVGGFGMGMASATLTVYVIDASEPGRQGANSAALQVNDQMVQSTVLAVGSVAFALLLGFDETAAFVAVMLAAVLLTLGTFWTQSLIDDRSAGIPPG